MLAHGRDLAGIADEPTLKIAGAHFGMELTRERRSYRERLVFTLSSRCQTLRAGRQIEGVPMPMKNWNSLLACALEHAPLPRFS